MKGTLPHCTKIRKVLAICRIKFCWADDNFIVPSSLLQLLPTKLPFVSVTNDYTDY